LALRSFRRLACSRPSASPSSRACGCWHRRQLLREAGHLGLQAGQALAQLRLVGLHEGRVQRGQAIALLHDLADAHVHALDHRRLQRLHHHVGQRIDQPALRDHHLVDLGERGPDQKCHEAEHQHMQRDLRKTRHGAALDLVGIGQVFDDGLPRGTTAPRQPALPARPVSQVACLLVP
jgi:hypothetical protein